MKQENQFLLSQTGHVCLYACVGVGMHDHACTQVCMCACIHVCMYSCIHVSMRVMYACSYICMLGYLSVMYAFAHVNHPGCAHAYFAY